MYKTPTVHRNKYNDPFEVPEFLQMKWVKTYRWANIARHFSYGLYAWVKFIARFSLVIFAFSFVFLLFNGGELIFAVIAIVFGLDSGLYYCIYCWDRIRDEVKKQGKTKEWGCATGHTVENWREVLKYAKLIEKAYPGEQERLCAEIIEKFDAKYGKDRHLISNYNMQDEEIWKRQNHEADLRESLWNYGVNLYERNRRFWS